MLQYGERKIVSLLSIKLSREIIYSYLERDHHCYLTNSPSKTKYIVATSAQLHFTGKRAEEAGYAAIGGIVVACLAAISRKNIVSILSQMLGEFILISAVDNLFDAKRKITSSTVNEFSLIILRRSNLGVCNSSIFLGRVSSMRLGLMHTLKSLLLCSSRCSLYRTV